MEKTIQRLINAIKNDKFAFEKYNGGGLWYGLNIMTMPLFASYGRIGYNVGIYDEGGWNIATITHDWEMNKTEVEYYN